jgi:hypothetical protein
MEAAAGFQVEVPFAGGQDGGLGREPVGVGQHESDIGRRQQPFENVSVAVVPECVAVGHVFGFFLVRGLRGC